MKGLRRSLALLSTIFISSLPCFHGLSASLALGHPCHSPCLLAAAHGRILAFDYSNKSSFSIVSNLSSPAAIDVHYGLGLIFWSDLTERNIKRSNMDGTNITVIHDDTKSYGLAVEWSSLLLYWTDDSKHTILVSDFEGNNIRTVISRFPTICPAGIVLDPHEGVMFWTQRLWGNVLRSTMYGAQAELLVRSNLSDPFGITLDRQNKLVFWMDEVTGAIESSDYDGNNRRSLFELKRRLFFSYIGIFFSWSYLFVTDIDGNGYKVDTFKGTVESHFYMNTTHTFGIVVFNSSLQLPAVLITCPVLPTPSNGAKFGCHWNIMYRGTECHFLCNYGYIGSGSNVRRCQRNGIWTGQEFSCQELGRPTCNSPCLLVSSYDRIFALEFGNKLSYIVVSNLTVPLALDFHYNLGYIFWSDAERNIKRSNINGTSIKVIHNNACARVCGDLAVEWNSLQLYWTDLTNGTISVSDLEGNNKSIVWFLKGGSPKGISLDPYEGLMFWTDWGSPPKIEKSTLNGKERSAIVTTNVKQPCGITLDRRNKLIFWVDVRIYVVESVDYSGNNRKLLVQRGGMYFYGVTFTSSYLFINEQHKKRVFQVDAYNGTVVGIVTSGGFLSGGIVAFDSLLQLPEIVCPALPAPTNGAILECSGNASFYYDKVCRFMCNNGYVGSGSRVRRCQQDGTWSGQEFICQNVTCTLPTIGVLLGCNTITTEMLYKAECRFSCRERVEEINPRVRICTENGTWSRTDLVCAGIISANTYFWRTLFSCPTSIDDLGSETNQFKILYSLFKVDCDYRLRQSI